MALIGWVALVGVLMCDVVAAESGTDPVVFEDVYANPIVVALSGVATLHILGALLIGVALMRTRLVALPLAVAFTAAAPVHLGSNLGGQLWLDAITWLVVAATGAVLAAQVLSQRVGDDRDGDVLGDERQDREQVEDLVEAEPRG